MSLIALQRDFRSWLTTEARDAGARIEGGAGIGLSVYLNNYRGSLMACLSGSYEATKAWLGEEAFDAAAASHIDRLPPHSWTLDDYAIDFPETLDQRYPDDPEVGDLARLERDLAVAFVGADADRLDPASLADVDWDSASLRFVPTMRIVTVSSNAGAIWTAITAGEQPPAADHFPAPAQMLIWRKGLNPSFRTLEVDEAYALTEMTAGRTFAALCTSLVEKHGEEDGPAMAGGLLGRWLRDGIVHAVVAANAI